MFKHELIIGEGLSNCECDDVTMVIYLRLGVYLPNVVQPCCREAIALRNARNESGIFIKWDSLVSRCDPFQKKIKNLFLKRETRVYDQK